MLADNEGRESRVAAGGDDEGRDVAAGAQLRVPRHPREAGVGDHRVQPGHPHVNVSPVHGGGARQN